MNWKSEGIIIPPAPEDPKSPLYPAHFMDRPHILYNERTGLYAAWLKIMGDGSRPAYFAVCTAPSVMGPYTHVKDVNPAGYEVGDFDLQKDPETGKAYLIFERPHTGIFIADLDEDYTDVAGGMTEHFQRTAPPDSREAPAHFLRNGKHYILTSGTTGYFPNVSEAAVSDSWHGPYRELGNVHPADPSGLSFNSQISSVFRHPAKKDLYIALADRWKPEIPLLAGGDYENGVYAGKIREKFRRIFDPNEHFVFTPEDAKDMYINSSVSDYVWLPIRFEGDVPVIDWLDSWAPDDY